MPYIINFNKHDEKLKLTFEENKIYTINPFTENTDINEYGFKYWNNLDDYFFHPYSVYTLAITIFEVLPLGKIATKDNIQFVTDKIKIIRVIPILEYNSIFKKHKFNENGNILYKEYPDGKWIKFQYDENNNKIREEESDGYWIEYQYNHNNKLIFSKNYKGYWEKTEYDENNNITYKINSKNKWKKQQFDHKNRKIYYEDSDGMLEKKQFDENDNQTYYEDHHKCWTKRQFDENNNLIDYEDYKGARYSITIN